MTDAFVFPMRGLTAVETETSAAPEPGQQSHLAPVVAAGGVAVLFTALLLVGGYGVVSHALAPRAAPAVAHLAPVATGADGKDKSDGTGPSAAGPTAPPERVSAPTPVQPADTVRYIRPGETLSQISRETGVSVDRLAQYNAIQKVDLIYADSALRVPYLLVPGQESGATAPAAPGK